MTNDPDTRSHLLADVAFEPDSRTPFHAVCRCGWRTAAYLSAGLAHSVFEGHLRCEAAREMSARAAVMRLETMAQRARSQAHRRRIAEVRSAILTALSIPGEPFELSALTTTMVTVANDPGVRLDLAQAVAAQPRLHLVGEGDSGLDAVVLSSIEQPRILVMDDDAPGIDGMESIGLVRCVAPRGKVCLYGERPAEGDQADLVVPKSVPPPDLVRLLLNWVA